MKREFFLLILIVKREKWLAHDWSLGCLPTVYGIEKLFFCNNDVSFQDSWRGIYRRIKGQELKWNKERSLARNTGRTFIAAWLGQFQQLLKTCVIYWSLSLHARGLPMQIMPALCVNIWCQPPADRCRCHGNALKTRVVYILLKLDSTW